MAYHLPQHPISAHAIHTQERNDCNYYATFTNKPTDSLKIVLAGPATNALKCAAMSNVLM